MSRRNLLKLGVTGFTGIVYPGFIKPPDPTYENRNKVSSEKVETMPEIKQDPKKRNCAPISYANAILWLADNGYPDLVQGIPSLPTVQKALVDKLTQNMKTDNIGTSRSDQHNGLANYIRSRGYDVEIEYYGCKVDSCGRFLSCDPDLDFIEEGVKGSSNVILALNEYEYDPSQKIYSPTLSHGVTVSDAIRLGPNAMDIVVSDSLGYFKKLRLSHTEDQSIIELLQARDGYEKVSSCLECERLDNRSEKYPDRILIIPDVVKFKVLN